MWPMKKKRILKYDKFTPVFRIFTAIITLIVTLLFHRFRVDAAVIFFAYLLFAFSLVLNRKFRKKIVLNYKYLIVSFDLLFISSLIMLTGSSASVFWPLYLVAIISFTVSRGGLSGLVVALISVIFYTAVLYYDENSFKSIPADFFVAVLLVTLSTTFLVNKDKKATMKLAITDALTGAYNFSYFQDQIDRAIECFEASRKPVALLFIDVDDFKAINDTYGHQRGDDVLKTIGEAIISATRKRDMVFRYGGDEFAVILQNTSKDEAFRVAERIRDNVKCSVDGLTTFKRVTVSIGIAILDEDSADKKVFLEIADRSLYEAKNKGKDRVAICSRSGMDNNTQKD